MTDNDLISLQEVGARVLGDLVYNNSTNGTIGQTMDSSLLVNEGSKGAEVC